MKIEGVGAVPRGDVVEGLGRAGVVSGDVVFVHASLRRLGHLESGPEMVIEALLEAVGPGGTVVMPGFSFQLLEVSAPVFDVLRTPVWASKLYEAFRTRAGVFRSHHVTHSVCAAGARARELTAEHSTTPCGAESPFRKLAAWGAKILLMGVSHNSSTTFHAAEEQEKLFYVGARELVGATLVDEQGRTRPLLSYVHQMSREYDFNRMDEPLTRAGAQQQTAIGGAIVRVVDARAMHDLAVAAVRRDPEALLMEGARMKISVTVSGELG